MERFGWSDERLAYALLRIVVGMNLMMHGVGRALAGPAAFSLKMGEQFAHTPLPSWSVHQFALILPFIEGLLGTLLLVGLRTRAALIGASLLMAVLTFGACLVQDWAAAGTQLMYALVLSALLFLHRYDGWSVDALISRH